MKLFIKVFLILNLNFQIDVKNEQENLPKFEAVIKVCL